ncbi:unnamed protein product, partial [Ectocarpus sp. 8 AP-2014]
ISLSLFPEPRAPPRVGLIYKYPLHDTQTLDPPQDSTDREAAATGAAGKEKGEERSTKKSEVRVVRAQQHQVSRRETNNRTCIAQSHERPAHPIPSRRERRERRERAKRPSAYGVA